MDFVTPLYHALQQQATLDHTRAVTADTQALGEQRQITAQILQNKLQSDNLTRQVLQQFASGVSPEIDPSITVTPSDSPQVAASKSAKAAQMQSQQYRNIATALQRAGADPADVQKYNKDSIEQNYRALQSAREAQEEQAKTIKYAASIAQAVSPDDEDSFNIAINRLDPELVRGLPFERGPAGQPLFTPRSVRVMQSVAAQGRTADEQAKLAAKVEADQTRALKQKEEAAVSQARVQELNSQTALNQTRARVLENPVPKAAAPVKPKPVTPANKVEREAANEAVDAEDFGEASAKWEPKARAAFAADVADRAKKYQISASNKGDELSSDDARQMAIDDLKPFVRANEQKKGFFEFSDKPKMLTYQRGKEVQTKTAPAGGAPEIRSQAEYDALPKGAAYMWNGKTGTKK